MATTGALIAVFLATVGGVAAAKVRLYMNAWDFAIYHQAVWLLSHGQELFLSTRGYHLLEHHLSWVLWPIAWVYRLHQDPVTLAWVQSGCTALAAVPVFLLAREVYRRDAVAVVWVALVLWNPGQTHALTYEFHPTALCLPAVCWLLYFLHRRTWWPAAIALVALLAIQEETALAVIFLGLGLLASGERRSGGVLLLVGVGYAALAYGVIIPHFSQSHEAYYLPLFDKLGSSAGEVAWSPILHPGRFWAALTTPGNGRYLLQLLAPVGALCLLKPAWSLAALPLVVLNMCCSFAAARMVLFHYDAVITAFLLPAAIAGGGWLVPWLEQHGVRRSLATWTPPTLAVLGTVVLPILGPDTFVRPTAYPFAASRQIASFGREHPWAAECDALLANIPPEASVSSSDILLPKLSGREQAWWFPDPFHPPPPWGDVGGDPASLQALEDQVTAALRASSVEYLVLEATPSNPLSREQYPTLLRAVARSGVYESAGEAPGITLYRRRQPPLARPVESRDPVSP